MREIKFRAWDTEREVMATVTHIGLDDYEVSMKDEECIRWRAPYPYVCRLMQYTGLEDVNGVEIYEGDIVKIVFNDFTESENFIGVIKYYEGMFSVDNGNESYKLFDELNMNEVIGNIYENPELLEA